MNNYFLVAYKKHLAFTPFEIKDAMGYKILWGKILTDPRDVSRLIDYVAEARNGTTTHFYNKDNALVASLTKIS